MEIPLGAQVECTDGAGGRSVYVLINPVNDQITHLVVQNGSSSSLQYMVPVAVVTETIADTIQLSCTRAQLEKMDLFVKTEFVEEMMPDYSGYHGGIYGVGPYYYQPYVSPETAVQVAVTHLQIPPGELAVRRGTRVEATDGFVGNVDEFVVNPANSYITDLVLREGHLWGKKNVIIPLSAIDMTRQDTVFLKLDKRQIGALPTFPVRWRRS